MTPSIPADVLLGNDICPLGPESNDGWSFDGLDASQKEGDGDETPVSIQGTLSQTCEIFASIVYLQNARTLLFAKFCNIQYVGFQARRDLLHF